MTLLNPCSRILLVLLLLAPGPVMPGETVRVGEFSSGLLDQWRERGFVGRTVYQLVEMDGRMVVHADSHASASGLYRPVSVDLERTPVLNWSWRVDALIRGNDERSRAGDDYPARVYVVFSGGARFWRTRAINYVWSSRQPAGSEWPNAFTANARMIAVASGVEGLGEWQHPRRNVLEDYRRLFGGNPPGVDAVAIMTDSDNTGQGAEAWYGDIWFSASPAPASSAAE